MSSPLGDALAAAREAERVWGEAAFATAEAVGFGVDDVDDIRVVVVVHGGQIIYMGVADGMLQLPADQLQDVINACIVNAFGMWREKLRTAAD